MSTSPQGRVLNARFVLSTTTWRRTAVDPLPQIAFVGRSNVGKSSLINALVNQNGLARTSSTPGRTQEIVLFAAEARCADRTIGFHLVDLPGYGYAKVPLAVKRRWRPMVGAYFAGNPHLRAALLLLDIRRRPTDEDLDLLEMMNDAAVPLIPVVTKIDKVPRTRRAAELKQIAAAFDLEDWRDLHLASAQTREGIADLATTVFDVLWEATGS